VNVLILHQHFNTPQTGGAIRSYYLAKALVDAGIQTTVISGHNQKEYKIENIEGITVHYLPVAYDNRFGFYKRSGSFVKYIVQAVKVAGTLANIDVCYAISVPLTIGIAAMWMKRRYKIPFIFEVGDLWPDAPVQLGFIKSYTFKQLLYGLERTIYKQAQAIVALSPMIKEAIEKKVPGKHIHLIPNMADTDYYQPESKQEQLIDTFGVRGKFVVSYTGALGIANGLDFYIECARASAKANLSVHFILCGDGAVMNRLKETVKRYALNNVSFVPFQNREGVRAVMNVTDASFVCYQPYPILETGSPNKYFDGLAAGKLILINFGGWIKHEIEQARCGVYIHAQNPADVVNKLEPFLKNSELLGQYQQAARQLAETRYARVRLSNQFVTVFDSKLTRLQR